MERTRTAEKADECFFLNGMNVSGMQRRGGGGEPLAGGDGGGSGGAGGGQEEPADFGNPSFIIVKPSSAERRLTDITEPLCLGTPPSATLPICQAGKPSVN